MRKDEQIQWREIDEGACAYKLKITAYPLRGNEAYVTEVSFEHVTRIGIGLDGNGEIHVDYIGKAVVEIDTTVEEVYLNPAPVKSSPGASKLTFQNEKTIPLVKLGQERNVLDIRFDDRNNDYLIREYDGSSWHPLRRKL